MSFDRAEAERAVRAQGRVIRVVVTDVAGSAPREPGAAMLVWATGQSGTIGGGALEWQAAGWARAMLEAQAGAAARVERVPLGPGLGQCCGGSVVLVVEPLDAESLAALGDGPVIARRIDGPEAMPMAVARVLAQARDRGAWPGIQRIGGWLVEPVAHPVRPIWIWGAGHVGRALVAVLAPLPDLSITWVDTAAERFPMPVPDGVRQVVAANPSDLVRHAPPGGEHLILTYSHTLDLELCHRLLLHGFHACGLIGSASKWARFRARLAALGHADAQISRIACPIGDPRLGKHPQAIALGVGAAILGARHAKLSERERAG